MERKNYLLRAPGESSRLDRQSELPAYSLEEELAGLEISEGGRILDAGCGSGALLGHLLKIDPSLALSGCDLLEEHVAHCRKNLPGSVQVWQHDLLDGPPKGCFDHVFLRYVAHHLGTEASRTAISHLKAVLRVGGRLTCIDAEGILVNLQTEDPKLRAMLERIEGRFTGNVRLASRLPGLMEEAGFRQVECESRVISYEGEMRRQEVEQFKLRFANGKAAFTSMLGSESEYETFVALYLAELGREQVPYAITKYRVSGVNA